jgi:hypothetical protein
MNIEVNISERQDCKIGTVWDCMREIKVRVCGGWTLYTYMK